jgi:hypothetical protein
MLLKAELNPFYVMMVFFLLRQISGFAVGYKITGLEHT